MGWTYKARGGKEAAGPAKGTATGKLSAGGPVLVKGTGVPGLSGQSSLPTPRPHYP